MKLPQPNDRISEYVLIERVGTGAFGQVFKARHHVWPDQIVAIKIPTDPDYVRMLRREGIGLHHVDFGGGLGIRYRDEEPPAIGELIAALLARVDARGHADKTVLVEPGRSIVGNAGVLLARTIVVKRGTEKNFAVVDAAMNDLMRPALYDAWHDIVAVAPRPGPARRYEVVGPVCESGDFLGHGRELAVEEGDLLAVIAETPPSVSPMDAKRFENWESGA